MQWQDYIELKPEVAMGKPIFKGTRLTVGFILERLGEGAAVEDLVQNYVALTPDHIRAATAYAAAVLRRDELVYSTRESWPNAHIDRALLAFRRKLEPNHEWDRQPATLGERVDRGG